MICDERILIHKLHSRSEEIQKNLPGIFAVENLDRDEGGRAQDFPEKVNENIDTRIDEAIDGLKKGIDEDVTQKWRRFLHENLQQNAKYGLTPAPNSSANTRRFGDDGGRDSGSKKKYCLFFGITVA